MFSHFFSRNWFKWTAIKYLQGHIERAIMPTKMSYVSVPYSPPKEYVARSKSPRIGRAGHSAYVPARGSVPRSRPAAVKANGGLRGSSATRWNRR